jgi:hypothetical protein
MYFFFLKKKKRFYLLNSAALEHVTELQCLHSTVYELYFLNGQAGFPGSLDTRFNSLCTFDIHQTLARTNLREITHCTQEFIEISIGKYQS